MVKSIFCLSHTQFVKTLDTAADFVIPTFAKTVFVAAIKHCISVVQIQRPKLHQMRPKYRQVIHNSTRPPLLNFSAWSHNDVKRCVVEQVKQEHQKQRFRDFKLDRHQYSTSGTHSLSKAVMWMLSFTKKCSKTNLARFQKPASEMISHLSISARHWEVKKERKTALKGSHDCYSDYFF